MGIARRSPQLFSSATIAGISVASQMALGLGAANASEVAPELGVADGASNGAIVSPPPLRSAGFEVGLDALALMKRERSEQRRVPKMLPLLAAHTEHGQVWVGLARNRGESQRPGELRLELCWMIAIGH